MNEWKLWMEGPLLHNSPAQEKWTHQSVLARGQVQHPQMWATPLLSSRRAEERVGAGPLSVSVLGVPKVVLMGEEEPTTRDLIQQTRQE